MGGRYQNPLLGMGGHLAAKLDILPLQCHLGRI